MPDRLRKIVQLRRLCNAPDLEVIDGQKRHTAFANARPGRPIATLSRGCARLVF